MNKILLPPRKINCLFTFFLLRLRHVFISGIGDLEDIADLGVGDVALGSLLELVNLFHLEMLDSSNVTHQGQLARSGKLAERAVKREPLLRNVSVEQVFFHLL